jgi:hypothetical protein
MLFIAEMHCIDKQFERDVHDSSSVYKPTGVCKDRARSTLVCAKIEQEAHWCAGHTDRTQKATAAGKDSESVRAKGRGKHRISSKSARDFGASEREPPACPT